MSSLDLIPDAGVLVRDWLVADPRIVALSANVAPRTPKSMSRPWIRVTQFEPERIRQARFDHAMTYPIQLDCYAGNDAMTAYDGQRVASLLGRTVRSVLNALEGSTVDDVVISSVKIRGPGSHPDITMEPAHERYILFVDILMHAT